MTHDIHEMRRENFEESKGRVPSNCQNTQEVNVLDIKNKIFPRIRPKRQSENRKKGPNTERISPRSDV